MTANPFDLDRQQPCLLVYRRTKPETPGVREMVQKVRARLAEEPAVALRLRERWSPSGLAEFAYPLDLAISGPDVGVARELAEQLVQRLRAEPKLADVAVNRDSMPHPRFDVTIDRAKAAVLGLSPQEIADAVALYTGSLAVGATDRAGPRWHVGVPREGQVPDAERGMKHIQLRNAQGQMVPLDTVVELRTVASPAAIYRLDTKPMVRVTANIADEKLRIARALCEQRLEQIRKEPGRAVGYRLTWLSGE
jgi:multidrug efflux pump subunit AcrB